MSDPNAGWSDSAGYSPTNYTGKGTPPKRASGYAQSSPSTSIDNGAVTQSASGDPYGDIALPGASYVPAPSNAPLATDPTYLAFMRALGAEQADVQSAGDLGVSNLQRELARRIPEIIMQGEEARRNISGGMESRGLFRSGEHELGLGRQRVAESTAIGNLQGTEADQESALRLQLAQRLASIQQQRSENTLNAAGQSYLQ